MDYTFKGLRSYYVLILMLLYIHLRPVFPAPVDSRCHEDLIQTRNLTNTVLKEANDLLKNYEGFYESRFGSDRKDVPDPKVSGDTISKKLQNISFKAKVFSLHISEAEEYHNSPSLQERFRRVKLRLRYLSGIIKYHFLKMDPQTAEPTSLQLSFKDDFDKIEYDWKVISNLKVWSEQVLKELQVEEVCPK